ncbi:hypothetical protein F4861DRAFT_541981 [Xylaria intraflava]|nr:hypothetical protein F4861DRAFT_541981 [Xylaria intraflava]
MDGSNFVPPYRRRDLGGDSGHADGEARPRQGNRQNNWGWNSGRAHRGSGRGGRGGYQRDFHPRQGPRVDDANLFHQNEINSYFWGSEQDETGLLAKATLRGSKDHPDGLAYVLLFFGANPRWQNNQIVFAKSNLMLLPEYAAKKAERGEWETQNEDKPGGELSDGRDVTTAPGQDVPKAMNQDSSESPAESLKVPSPSPEVKKQSPGIKRLVAKSDGSTSTDSTGSYHSAMEDLKSRVDEEHAQHEETKYRAGTEAEETADNEAQGTANSAAQTPAAPSSRFKYTDIRKEEEQAQSNPSPSTAPDNRMKYADIRTVPASQFYNKPTGPTFPAIAPIDYVPSNSQPVAIFEEQWVPNFRASGHAGRFAFRGWFKVSRVNLLAPHSAELVRMLHQKWERKDRFGNIISSQPRDPSAWNASLSTEWAVIKFELMSSEEAPPPPTIEKRSRLPYGDGAETKSVNEMLAEMRLNDGQKDVSQEEDAMAKQGGDNANTEIGDSQDTPASDK